MVLESNRDLVLRRLTEALGRDRTRHQVSEVTSLGLVQMTRKKLGTGLVEAFSTTCEHCHGRGILVHTYPVELAGAEEGARGGRETGPRRRRGRDKGAAASAPAATNGTPHVAEDDAEIAVKRAHPVALAMAAHQSEEAAHAEDIEEVAVAEATAVDTDVVAATDAAPVEEVVVSESVAALAEEVAEAVAEEVAEAVVEEVAAAEAVAEPALEPVSGAVVAPVEVRTPSSVADEPGEPAAVVTTEAPASANGVPESVAPRTAGRRRRVARSAAAPAADSGGAVFVLPTADQASAGPVVDYTADAPVVVPTRKPRRRAVGRPAGPPVDDAN